jgi:sigma-54 specific flagellar transcriptional regulator A
VAAAILDRIAAERGVPAKRLSDAALAGLGRHAWPGNVRELENALRAAALFAETEVIELDDLVANVGGLRGLFSASAVTTGGDPLHPLPRAIDARLSSSPTAGEGWEPRAIADDGAIADAPAGAEDTPPSTSPTPSDPGPVTLSCPDSCEDGMVLALDSAAMSQPSKIAHPGSNQGPFAATEVAYAAIRAGISLSDLKRDIERDCIARALAETGGNITRAASLLGMKRPRLSQLVKQYGFGAPVDVWGPAGTSPATHGPSGAGGDPDGDAEDTE